MLIAVSSPDLDPAVCERARLARDARFDGLFFTAVKTTGIYCRPVCPAPAPKPRNVEYFSTAAAAAAAGYRPCLRCRPERAPGAPAHRVGSDLVAGALRLIEHGLLDDASVATLAARVGVGERHLRRLFADELGAGPLDVAATRRLLFAKQLLSETALPITQVAGAAGYGSLRRFNAAFLDAYGKAPRDFRRADADAPAQGDLVLRLPYRAPYDFEAMLAFFARRAIPGVEAVDATSYRRSIVIDGDAGWFEVTRRADDEALSLRVSIPRPSLLGPLVARVRRQFDVDAEPAAIAAVLSRSALLRPLVDNWPGQRLPGAWDGFELAVRGILGQQISVAAARTFAARIVAAHGTPLGDAGTAGVDALFPTPAQLVDAPLEAVGLPKARAATIRGLAAACIDGRVGFEPEQTLARFVERFCVLPGIGAWTAHYIAMRALSQPDAFPAGDLILRRLAGSETPLSERAMDAMSQDWRPWRAYAVMLLWRSAG